MIQSNFNPSPAQQVVLTISSLLQSDADGATMREKELAAIEMMLDAGVSHFGASVMVTAAKRAYAVADRLMRNGALPGDAWQQAFSQI